MIASLKETRCEQSELVAIYALRALPSPEAAAFEAHLAGCSLCQDEIKQLRPIVDCFIDLPTDDMQPPNSVPELLARRIASETGREFVLPTTRTPAQPDWEAVSPGISCKVLATDATRDRVSMLVRLAPGASYPSHTHAGVEELFLLDGELWIDGRKLVPGDYNRAEPGSRDESVWSETGCTCVLIASMRDVMQ
jgi:anti-sigma factor ChrR (cupin superfamily)